MNFGNKSSRRVGELSQEHRPQSPLLNVSDKFAGIVRAAIIADKDLSASRAGNSGEAPRARRCFGGGARPSLRCQLIISTALALIAVAGNASAADLSPMFLKSPSTSAPYDWSGFYIGGNIGYAWGTSNWTAAPNSGSLSLYQGLNSFDESGSFFLGLQAGYNYTFNNRVVVGAEVDGSAPSFAGLNFLTIGGISNFNSPVYGPLSFSENVLDSGTLRGRLGYAPGNWLFYVTGGLALSYNQPSLTQVATGISQPLFLWRAGYAAGAGVEVPFMPHWTARFEYLYTGYPSKSIPFPEYNNLGPTFTSNWSQQQLRVGVNYQFNDGTAPAKGKSDDDAPWKNASDTINFHAQSTFVEQSYPPFSSPYQTINLNQNSTTGAGQGKETFDATLFAGVRLWQGAELWVNPEIDQGFGFADTHGFGGFPSAESYKVGLSYPYARVPRYFVRDTFNLGGDSEKLDADLNQFAGSRTENRLVVTVGKFSVVDLFDTNKYANNVKNDFLNWAAVNSGALDYAGDAWALTYAAAAELYLDRYAFRMGIFDLSDQPAGGITPTAYGADQRFHEFQWFWEAEERHELWGQPGKLKITAWLQRGEMGAFADAVALAQQTDQQANINAVRKYRSRPGVSGNMEQALTDTIGVFARVGWADGNLEPWDNTDIDYSGQAGFSFNGKPWGRPNDTIGIMQMVNGISTIHQEFLNYGGLGILVGDGQLPHPGLEYITEAYYSYALTDTTKLSADYQFVVNPAYNRDRGPVNVFAGRFHWQF